MAQCRWRPSPEPQATTSKSGTVVTAGSVRVNALRLLASRRLTEAQLWARLKRRGHPEPDIAAAIDQCKRDGFVDDKLFAQLFVDGHLKAVGDVRLVADLVRRGIDREAAQQAVAQAGESQTTRLQRALAKLFRTRPTIGLPSAARALQRLGFPTPAIYRVLRERASRHDGALFLDIGERARYPLSFGLPQTCRK